MGTPNLVPSSWFELDKGFQDLPQVRSCCLSNTGCDEEESGEEDT